VRLSLTFTGFGALASNLPAVKAAEEAGFDGVWYAEHICMHDAIVPATAFLCATERLEIGVVGLSIAGRHPGVTAMELASLAELGPGRVRAAVGLGVPEMVAKLGKKITKPIAETTQLVQSLRQALAGLDLNFERPGYKFEQYKLNPMGPPPPIDVMAVRPRMQETAAVIGDGISLSIGGSHSYIADVVQRCEEVLAREGRSRQDFRVTAVVAAESCRRSIRAPSATWPRAPCPTEPWRRPSPGAVRSRPSACSPKRSSRNWPSWPRPTGSGRP
jgi:5,10-methylenetetrahydromethanopterin reductase